MLVDTIVVEHPEGERSEKGLDEFVLRRLRACVFECQANEDWLVVPVAVSGSRLLSGSSVVDDVLEPADSLCALLLVCKEGYGKVNETPRDDNAVTVT